MDVGKKCLFIAGAGALLIIISAPFVIKMAFMGGPLTNIVFKEVLEPSEPNVYWTGPKIIMDMKMVMEFHLNPKRGEQYMVSLNSVTNGTIDALIFKKNSTNCFQSSFKFNAGNNTIENLEITEEGIYALNATSADGKAVNATFRVIESWSILVSEFKEETDLLGTFGSLVAFATGIVLLIYSLIRLRKEAGRPYSEATGESGYVEIEEE